MVSKNKQANLKLSIQNLLTQQISNIKKMDPLVKGLTQNVP